MDRSKRLRYVALDLNLNEELKIYEMRENLKLVMRARLGFETFCGSSHVCSAANSEPFQTVE